MSINPSSQESLLLEELQAASIVICKTHDSFIELVSKFIKYPEGIVNTLTTYCLQFVQS